MKKLLLLIATIIASFSVKAIAQGNPDENFHYYIAKLKTRNEALNLKAIPEDAVRMTGNYDSGRIEWTGTKTVAILVPDEYNILILCIDDLGGASYAGISAIQKLEGYTMHAVTVNGGSLHIMTTVEPFAVCGTCENPMGLESPMELNLKDFSSTTSEYTQQGFANRNFCTFVPNVYRDRIKVTVTSADGSEQTYTTFSDGGDGVTITPSNISGYSLIQVAGKSGMSVKTEVLAQPIVTQKTHKLAIGEAGIATLHLDFNALIPEGAEVWYASDIKNGSVKMKKLQGSVLPKGCGVIVRGDAGQTYTFAETSAVAPVTKSLLVGSTNPKNYGDDYNKYFYLDTNGSAPRYCLEAANGRLSHIISFQSYLKVDNASAEDTDIDNGLGLEWEEQDLSTVIHTTATSTAASTATRNLHGVRVSDSYKGIVIHGSKKIIRR